MPYRPTSRTRARAADVRERILRAAHDQLAEGGFASAGVAAIARRAGVATGTVYRHFPSKGELLAEAFRRASQREVDVVAAAGSVQDAVEVFVRRALAEPVRAYALIAEPVEEAVDHERLAFRRAYGEVFARLLPDPGDDVVAAALVGALAEAMVGPLARHDRDPDQLVETLQRFCLNAIGRTPHVVA
ncbi:MAG: helix-turn-helix domain-containing protein [Solirubrobacteraceae bacterium]